MSTVTPCRLPPVLACPYRFASDPIQTCIAVITSDSRMTQGKKGSAGPVMVTLSSKGAVVSRGNPRLARISAAICLAETWTLSE